MMHADQIILYMLALPKLIKYEIYLITEILLAKPFSIHFNSFITYTLQTLASQFIFSTTDYSSNIKGLALVCFAIPWRDRPDSLLVSCASAQEHVRFSIPNRMIS